MFDFAGPDWRFAFGWNEDKLLGRLFEIDRFARFNRQAVVSFERRRRIVRLAYELLTELDGIGGLEANFLDTLRLLAGPKRERQTSTRVVTDPKTGMSKVVVRRGGDRRSGERTLKGAMLGMVVRLYGEAHEEPGFGDPLVRFANAAGRQMLGVEANPFTPMR